MDRRPAVSRITTSKPSRRPVSMARRAICTGVSPATIGSDGTPACCASWASWSWAAGRWVSRDASSTLRRSRSFRRSAILPAVVVLPEPCRPTIRIGTGGAAFRLSGTAPSPPSSSIITSLTILTICWPGVTEVSTSEPSARSRTLAMKSRTTGSATSASSKATRTSLSASPMSVSDRAPRWRRRSKTPESLSDRASNIMRTLGRRRLGTTNAPLREPSRSGGAPASGGDRVGGLARMLGCRGQVGAKSTSAPVSFLTQHGLRRRERNELAGKTAGCSNPANTLTNSHPTGAMLSERRRCPAARRGDTSLRPSPATLAPHGRSRRAGPDCIRRARSCDPPTARRAAPLRYRIAALHGRTR